MVIARFARMAFKQKSDLAPSFIQDLLLSKATSATFVDSVHYLSNQAEFNFSKISSSPNKLEPIKGNSSKGYNESCRSLEGGAFWRFLHGSAVDSLRFG